MPTPGSQGLGQGQSQRSLSRTARRQVAHHENGYGQRKGRSPATPAQAPPIQATQANQNRHPAGAPPLVPESREPALQARAHSRPSRARTHPQAVKPRTAQGLQNSHYLSMRNPGIRSQHERGIALAA